MATQALAMLQAVLQTLVADDKRGCVMSLYTVAFRGIAPLGSLIAGSVATRLGAPPTVRLGGVGCLVGALLFAYYLPALRQRAQPISANQGLMRTATLRTQTTINAWLNAH
jgi:predicted MFS family arabinose efflux permease